MQKQFECGVAPGVASKKNRKNLNQIKGATRLKAQRELDAAPRRRPEYAKLRADAQASLTKAKRALAALERATQQLGDSPASTCPRPSLTMTAPRRWSPRT
jgi:hypothetical protein